jgi:hypothetical protein
MDVSKNDWVKIICDIREGNKKLNHEFEKLNGNLIGFTGGKDSTLAISLLKDSDEKDNEVFTIHTPTESAYKIREILGVDDWKETVIIREINEELFTKNINGALNGHTPFSIVVGFIGLFTASLRNKKYVIVSNEESASEPTVPGTDINHQYSKSFEFEKSFQEYTKNLWPEGPKYFSILRPISEIATISILKNHEGVMPYISSCNKIYKEVLWCGKCPKCLFSFLMFSAIWNIEFAKKIFGADMFSDTNNMETLLELTGLTVNKPFECVGTTAECLAALAVIYKNKEALDEPLLKEFFNEHKDILPTPKVFQNLACDFHEHSMPSEFSDIIKKAQKGICHE